MTITEQEFVTRRSEMGVNEMVLISMFGFFIAEEAIVRDLEWEKER